MEKKWIGDIPERCDLCGWKITGTFIRGWTHTGLAIRVIMCAPCHVLHGVGLGTGKGQLYNTLGEKLKG